MSQKNTNSDSGRVDRNSGRTIGQQLTDPADYAARKTIEDLEAKNESAAAAVRICRSYLLTIASAIEDARRVNDTGVLRNRLDSIVQDIRNHVKKEGR